MQHISEVIGSIFDRGTLPEQILVRRAVGPITVGQVLTWDARERAYMHHTGRWVVWALTVRQGLGRIFEAYSPAAGRAVAIEPQNGIKAA